MTKTMAVLMLVVAALMLLSSIALHLQERRWREEDERNRRGRHT